MRQLQTKEDGGNAVLQYLAPAVSGEQMLENMKSSISRGLPEVKFCLNHNTILSICGGGPSIEDTYQQLEGYVACVNGSLQWLIEKGGAPNAQGYACGVCDAGDHIADSIAVHDDVRYYVASICHPKVFDKLKDNDVRLFHVTPASTGSEEEITNLLNMEYDEWIAIGGGCTMGLRWFNLGYYLGFRRFYGHGLDSSFRDNNSHAYPDRADRKNWMKYEGRWTRPNFMAQVHDFAEMLEVFHDINPDIEIKIFGDGLLQDEWNSFKKANPDAFSGEELRRCYAVV